MRDRCQLVLAKLQQIYSMYIDVDLEKGIWLSLRADGCGRLAWEEGGGGPAAAVPGGEEG